MRRLARRARVRAENARQGFLVVGTGEDIIAAAKASDVGGDVATVEEAGDEAGAAEAPDVATVLASEASSGAADAMGEDARELGAAGALDATTIHARAAGVLDATTIHAGAVEALDTTRDEYASFDTAIEMMRRDTRGVYRREDYVHDAVIAPVAAGLVTNALDGTQYLVCSFCDKKYNTERGLKRHVDLNHPG